jgi:hypothetical protein
MTMTVVLATILTVELFWVEPLQVLLLMLLLLLQVLQVSLQVLL